MSEVDEESLGLAATRTGFALPIAVFVLAVGAALIAGTFWLAVIDRRTGDMTLEAQKALSEAEAMVNGDLGTMDPRALVSMPVGPPTVDLALVGAGALGDRLWRLNSHLFLVAGAGARRAGAAVRGVGVLFRLEPPRLVLDRPLSTPGAVAIGSGARVEFLDPSAEAGPECTESPGAGSTPDPYDFSAPRYESLSSWVGAATVFFPAGAVLAVGPSYSRNTCNTADAANWGEPDRQDSGCGRYFPVIYASGDLTISGGKGQGVLLVEGSLTVSGAFEFWGLAIVGKSLNAIGPGTRFVGAVQVDDTGREGSSLGTGVVISYSACVLGRSTLALGTAKPLTERSWIQLF